MPRTKGSKNCVTASTDCDAQIAKLQKAEIKQTEKAIAKLEAKKAAAEAKATEVAKKVEAEAVLKKLLASGMTADEILEKLK